MAPKHDGDGGIAQPPRGANVTNVNQAGARVLGIFATFIGKDAPIGVTQLSRQQGISKNSGVPCVGYADRARLSRA